MYDNADKITSERKSKSYKIEQIKCSLNYTDTQIKDTFNAFILDNPNFFWITNEYFVNSLANISTESYITMQSSISKSDLEVERQNLKQAISSYIDSIPKPANEFDKALYIHDKLVQNCSYDENNYDNFREPYSAYGALVKKRALCEGFSRAMQILLREAGIECRLIVGEGKGEGHMWNLVKIDEMWYHVDSTWDVSKSVIRHNYFNLNDKLIENDHEIDKDSKQKYKIPDCISLENNFYSKKAVKISTFDDNSKRNTATELVILANKNQDEISFQFDQDLNYEDSLNKLLLNSKNLLQECVTISNKNIKGKKIDASHIEYIEDKNQRGITVKINYSK
jgi:transglutaminase/protease-like cytokinesis protein 3